MGDGGTCCASLSILSNETEPSNRLVDWVALLNRRQRFNPMLPGHLRPCYMPVLCTASQAIAIRLAGSPASTSGRALTVVDVFCAAE